MHQEEDYISFNRKWQAPLELLARMESIERLLFSFGPVHASADLTRRASTLRAVGHPGGGVLRDCWLADQGCLGPVQAIGGGLHQLQQLEAKQSEGEQTHHG